MTLAGQKRKREDKHPYLDGNFAPVKQIFPLTPCSYTGCIPDELAGGQYVRNGGNPVTNEDLGRDAHWFDGDGMLCGVSFTRFEDADGKSQVLPDFVNQYILTDLYLSTLGSPSLRHPILPSIATLVNPLASLFLILYRIIRTVLLVTLSFLYGSKQAIRKISVANTSIYYHDGRALAGCESGPPMRVSLPGLETVGWYDAVQAEGESGGSIATSKDHGNAFGGGGLFGFMKEWTTAHPKVDQKTGEMILFHSSFAPPHVHYSVIPESNERSSKTTPLNRLVNAPVPGVCSAKMMHDFGVSPSHTIIMDLPLSLDPLNLAKGRPVVEYDSSKASRFGIFPRRDPSAVRWFETSACCIFHTANTWDSLDYTGRVTSVNLLSCRLTSASLVFSAGNLDAPQPQPTKIIDEPIISEKSISFFESYDQDELVDEESSLLKHANDIRPSNTLVPILSDPCDELDQCRLYYHSFSLSSQLSSNTITHQFALSAIPFEFPSLRKSVEMSAARFIYGCSTTSTTSFGTALARAVKIDALVKMNVHELISRGKSRPPRGITGCVDTRNIHQIIASTNPEDPIKVFKMPSGWFAQEPQFVPRHGSQTEDDGYLLTYAFDESQLLPSGECKPDAKSELWVIDARNMDTVVCRVQLPQRVPYGLHGNWFTEDEVLGQRGVEKIRSTDVVLPKVEKRGIIGSAWIAGRRWMERRLA
ncbi:MAG: hypothetical protein M1820_006660 [Bogoriella megaspora]|nr:MAG: hypothetical protein M1820_006660 [Bogoriella megaspora]